MTIPAWPFRPDWSSPIVETLEWLTAIQVSRSGAEQRQTLRLSPRRRIDYPVQLYGQERAFFDVWLMKNGGRPWYLPLPHENVTLTYAAQEADVFLPFDTSYTEFAVGGKAVLQGRNVFTSEVVEVTSVASNGIGVSALTKNYQNGLTIGPAVLGQITDDVSMNRPTGAVYHGTVRFQSLESLSRTPTADFPLTYLGYPVLTTQPNASEELEYDYTRKLSVIDNKMSVPRYVDRAATAFGTQKHDFFLFGRQERSNFRDLLYRLRGQSQPVWVPTFNDDLSPGQGWPDPDDILTSIPGRTVALQFNRNGTYEVLSSSSAGTVVTAPLYSNSVARTSFMTLKRLNIDAIEFSHYAMLDGVATVSLQFRDAPDLRVAGSYFKNPFASSDPTASTQPSLDMTGTVTVSGAAGGM